MSKFDHLAATWDEKPSRIAMARKFGEKIRESLDLAPKHRLVDYGCGTGSCAIYLSEWVGSVLGVDASAPMLERFGAKASAVATPIELLHANLEDSHIHFGNPDVIISTMTFHHLSDPRAILAHFFEELQAGGSIAIVDLDVEDGSFHDDGNEGVKHFGFARGAFRRWLEEIGFEGICDATIHEIHKNDRTYSIFLIQATKPLKD